MKASTFTEALICAIDADEFNADPDGDASDDEVLVGSVASYRDGGILTYDNGLVVKLDDGSEFQVTVVRVSAPGIDEEEED